MKLKSLMQQCLIKQYVRHELYLFILFCNICDVTSDCDSILYVVTNLVVLMSQRQFSTQVDNKVIQYKILL